MKNNVLESGQIIGDRYKIIKVLGSGGFAITYIAEDLNNRTEEQAPQQCVVKQLQPAVINPRIWKKAKERFKKEANTLARLGNHPQIPTLFAYIEENQQLYLIQEFIEGEEFTRVIRSEPFNEIEVIIFLQEVLAIVNFIHQEGVIHRDIKPSNLIKRKTDGRIVLIDFGAVKEIVTFLEGEEGKKPYTQIIGTPGYMAPEQERGQPVFCSDIYALGKTAIFALTGSSPVDFDEDIDNWPKYLPKKNKSLSPQLITIINKMVAPLKNERYQSAIEVLADLEPLTLIGKTIANSYEITNYLGGGNQTQIYTYLATNHRRSYQSPCVIKQLTPTSDDPADLQEIQQTFLQELKILQKLGNHPQIPQLWDHFEYNKQFYLVQEYIAGDNLEKELQLYKCLSEENAIDILEQVLRILDFVHKQGVIHQDLKPSNLIRRTEDNLIFLIDFGNIKSITNSFETQTTTSTSRFVGSEGYISPEQLAGRTIYSSDLYSLGMIVIHALTGIHPSQLSNHPQTGQILWKDEVRVNPHLVQILEKMVELNIKRRYSHASEVLKDIQRYRLKPKANQNQSAPLPLFSRWYGYLFVGWASLFLLLLTVYVVRINQASFLFQQGDLKQESGEYEIAVKYYEQGLQIIPPGGNIFINRERVWLKKAFAFSAAKNYEAMLEACEQAIAIKPNISYPHICKGIALHELGQDREAIASYQRAKQLEPNSFEVWHNLGNIYAELGEKDQAIAHLQQAIEIGGEKSFVSWNDLGKLYYRFQDYNLAIQAYQEALKVNPKYIPAWVGLGNVQNYLNEHEAAISAYNEALKINELNYEAWYGKGLAYEGLKDYTRALDSYERAIFINPKYKAALDARMRVKGKL